MDAQAGRHFCASGVSARLRGLKATVRDQCWIDAEMAFSGSTKIEPIAI
jgi:hypothetical protein